MKLLKLTDGEVEFEEMLKDDKKKLWFTVRALDTVDVLLSKEDAVKIMRVLDDWVSRGTLDRTLR